MNEMKALPEVQELSDQVGEFVYYWGFKRIHGKIWTHLFLATEPLDAAELVKRLNISKALVSISIRELIDYEVVLLAGKSPRGTQLYKTNPDILSVILAVLRQRERRILSRVEAAQGVLNKVDASQMTATGVSHDKVQQLGQLVQTAAMHLESLIALKAVNFGEWSALFNMVGAMSSASALTTPEPNGAANHSANGHSPSSQNPSTGASNGNGLSAQAPSPTGEPTRLITYPPENGMKAQGA